MSNLLSLKNYINNIFSIVIGAAKYSFAAVASVLFELVKIYLLFYKFIILQSLIIVKDVVISIYNNAMLPAYINLKHYALIIYSFLHKLLSPTIIKASSLLHFTVMYFYSCICNLLSPVFMPIYDFIKQYSSMLAKFLQPYFSPIINKLSLYFSKALNVLKPFFPYYIIVVNILIIYLAIEKFRSKSPKVSKTVAGSKSNRVQVANNDSMVSKKDPVSSSSINYNYYSINPLSITSKKLSRTRNCNYGKDIILSDDKNDDPFAGVQKTVAPFAGVQKTVNISPNKVSLMHPKVKISPSKVEVHRDKVEVHRDKVEVHRDKVSVMHPKIKVISPTKINTQADSKDGSDISLTPVKTTQPVASASTPTQSLSNNNEVYNPIATVIYTPSPKKPDAEDDDTNEGSNNLQQTDDKVVNNSLFTSIVSNLIPVLTGSNRR